jgi:hypothetical protein
MPIGNGMLDNVSAWKQRRCTVYCSNTEHNTKQRWLQHCKKVMQLEDLESQKTTCTNLSCSLSQTQQYRSSPSHWLTNKIIQSSLHTHIIVYTTFTKSWTTQQEESQHSGYATGSATKDWCWYQQGTTDVIPAVQHLVSSLRARGATPLLCPCAFTLRTFVQNQMARLLANNDMETTWKVVRASPQIASQHLHTGPEENYKKNPNSQPPGWGPEYKAVALCAL